jgi:hypothetical protein
MCESVRSYQEYLAKSVGKQREKIPDRSSGKKLAGSFIMNFVKLVNLAPECLVISPVVAVVSLKVLLLLVVLIML